MDDTCFYCRSLTHEPHRQLSTHVVHVWISGYKQVREVCGYHLHYLVSNYHVEKISKIPGGK